MKIDHFDHDGYQVRGSKWVIRVLLVFLLVSATARILHAQASSGITGTVTDASGGVIPGAKVVIASAGNGSTVSATTSSAGTYAVTGLVPGRYTVTVAAPSFKEAKVDVLVEIGTQATVDIPLSAGAVTETVEVQASSVALNTTSPQIGTTVEPQLINNLPIELAGRGREISSFQFLAPGVQGNTFTTEISGGVNFQEEVVYNGVPMPQSETEGMQNIINAPFEMVNEFRIQTSTFSAQYGLAQGAVNYQTASGTNTFHGDVFEINRNSSLDSKGFLDPARVPIDHENNYGFTVGGPVLIPKLYNGRNRTFFHFTWENFKQNATVQGTEDTVPTAQERTGDFSDFVNGTTGQLIPIYDPTTGQQFQYNGKLNVIPPDRLSANALALLQYEPLPDRTGINAGGLDENRNYDPYPNPTTNSNFGFTIDHNLTKNQSLHYSEWRNHLQTEQVFVTGPLVAPPNPLNSVAAEPQIGTGFLLTYTNTLTPHLVLTAGAGWLGEINDEIPVTKVNLPNIVTNGVVFPQINFSGNHAPTQWGSYGSLQDSINRKLGIDFVNNWLWTRGRHSFNFGGEIRRLYQDGLQAGNGGGDFNFSQNETSTPPGANGQNQGAFPNDGSPFASFLLGLPDSANRTLALEVKLRNFDVSPYVQDDFKLNPRLTVNMGIRWDIMVPFTDATNSIAFLNASALNSETDNLFKGVATTYGHCATCAGFDRANIHWKHFGPRLGFAYMLNNKTVLQSGFSLAFMNGGAYSFGDTVVADDYSGLLAGAYTLNSSGTNHSNYGSWDGNPLPLPAPVPVGPKLGVGNTIYTLDKLADGYAPYTQQWNVNIQRELPWDVYLTVAYVGNREIHIISNLNHPNEYPDSALQYGPSLDLSFANGTAQAAGFTVPYPNFVADLGANATVYQAQKPYPQFTNVVNSFEGSGTVYYNGLQTQVEKRYTNGIAFLYSLTLARTMSNNDFGNASGFAADAMDKYRQRQEWSRAGTDQKYNTKLSGTYDLPFGSGKKFVNKHGVLNEIVGGFQVGGILDYEGGTPYSVSQQGDPGLPNGFNRPNRISSVHLSTADYGRVKAWALQGAPPGLQPTMFNTAAFATTGNTFVLGDASREYSSLRSNPYRNENLTATKRFTIGSHVKGKLQVDFYNAFNRALLSSGPNTSVNTDPLNPNPSFGKVTGIGQSNSNRQGQATLKLEF